MHPGHAEGHHDDGGRDRGGAGNDRVWRCRLGGLSRKSTSGGVRTVGVMAVNMWRSTQIFVVTRVGEDEYYALAGRSAEVG